MCNSLVQVPDLITHCHLRDAENHCHSWFNMDRRSLQLLVESEGCVATVLGEESKVNLRTNFVLLELVRQNGLVYEVDGLVLVNSGRPMPEDGEPVQEK